mmetsp:Transcript_19402/g.42379  ORF Transcript_19402/g.42379 Transcript_19402/m.42379 type:complete len:159 (-) Transcript_19402:108-584(-)|eukprot:CAMPEP_0170609744 /NCGR_PEP_ID=MMETSP0224-20130122/22287_1 /TAXON_ID=285029 /ORGANISM="Togula jolla, Strain CCCM 725" /LENGTH=158 /DNA_ID=CAMNT_0010935069 /DNA_START=48 /DNA_END=524 /DNA_ORIENTATION=-
MGTPSGSRNSGILQDAEELRNLREFGYGGIIDSHLRVDCISDEPQRRLVEKLERVSERREFRNEKIKSRSDRRRRRVLRPTVLADGHTERKLPSFLKLKGKEVARRGEKGSALCTSTPVPSPEPLVASQGKCLVAYDSDDSSSDSSDSSDSNAQMASM